MMDNAYIAVSIAVGVMTILAAVWKFGRWQAQQEDHLKDQDTAIAELRKLMRRILGEDDDD